MSIKIHPSWQPVLASEFEKPYWQELDSFVKKRIFRSNLLSKMSGYFPCFRFDSVWFCQSSDSRTGSIPYSRRCYGNVLLGSRRKQDSTKSRISSKELESDIGTKRTQTNLSDWAEQWVLLLNSVLTVRAHEAASHQKKWWEIFFTDEVIRLLSDKREHLVFILWWNYAVFKKSLIDASKHSILTSPHPSPFSVHKGFFGRSSVLENEWIPKEE